MKILYGVPGEGMGHATRSKVIITHLLEKHDVKIVTSGKAFPFLLQAFPGRVHQIKGLNFVYDNGSISKLKTVQHVLKTGPKDFFENLEIYKKLKTTFVPDLVISDFETSAYLYAKYLKIPVISIDNIQALTRCKIEINIPKEEKENYTISQKITALRVPNCNHCFITTFFDTTPIKPNTTLISPIIRNEIIKQKTSVGKHILVYQTSSSQTNLIEILNNVKHEEFYVYGFNKDEQKGNCLLKSFSETGFINDLASAKAVISNGGYSLISEAVYLHKPVCSYPIANQFEQYLNAAYIEKMGFGKHLNSFSADGIKAFLYDLSTFTNNIKQYKQKGNVFTFQLIDEWINNLPSNETQESKV